MAKFEVSEKLRSNKDLNDREIIQFIRSHLEKTCKITVISEKTDCLVVEGRVAETLFTPMTKFDARFTVKVEADKARITAEGKSTPNWVFWLFFLVGLFTGVFLLIAIVLFLIQRNKPKEACEAVLKAVDTEFGAL